MLERRAHRRVAEGADRFAIDPRRRDGDDLLFRPTQRGQIAAETTAGIDAERVVHPLGLDDRGASAIPGGPMVANGEPKFVGLATGFAIETEFANRARGAADHILSDAG